MDAKIYLEGNILTITGATRVVSVLQNQAVIETKESGVIASGNGLEVKKLNLDENEVVLSGNFSNLKIGAITTKKTPLIKKIFK